MPDQFPHHTPYTGPLPITVDGYLAGHPNRKLVVRPIKDAPPGHYQFGAYLISEHGWPLSLPRAGGQTELGARLALRPQTIHRVEPGLSADGTRWA